MTHTTTKTAGHQVCQVDRQYMQLWMVLHAVCHDSGINCLYTPYGISTASWLPFAKNIVRFNSRAQYAVSPANTTQWYHYI
jgi:hypothetical protein